MLARLITTLVVLLGLNPDVVGQTYYLTGSKTSSVNLTGDTHSIEGDKETSSTYFSIFEDLAPGETNFEAKDATRRLPVVIEETVKPGEKASEKSFEKLNYFATYDKGFALLPYDKKKQSFDLKINGWIQFRYHGFARNVDSWTDNAGVTRAIR